MVPVQRDILVQICCPVQGWDRGITTSNAQVLIYDPEGHVIVLDSANYELLAELHLPASAPTELFIRAVIASGK